SSGFSILLNRAGKTLGNPFGYGDAGFNVTLDDAAANGDIHSYQNFVVPVGQLTGTWAPDGRNVDPATAIDLSPRTALLSSFNGTEPNGQWVLFIAVVVSGDVRTLVRWEFQINEPLAAVSIINLTQWLPVGGVC